MKKKVCLTILVSLLSVRAFAQPPPPTIPGLADAIKALADQIKLLVEPPPPVPVPVNCQVTPWSLQSAEPWLACDATGQQTRLETWIRTITVPQANGGAACPVLTESRTATQACTPPPPPPPPTGFVLRTASNTGLAGVGVAESSLVTTPGTTYGAAFNGQTITGKRFTGRVNVTGNNITFDKCLFNPPGGSSLWLVDVTGSGTVISNSTFRPQSGSQFIGIILEGGSLLAQFVDIARFENNISVYGGSLTLDRSYIHDSSNASNSAGHRDAIEIYGGSNHVLKDSTIIHPVGETAGINIAPWGGSTSVANVTISGNYLDGGHTPVLVDLQSTGSIHFVRVVRNRFGGHSEPGVFGSYAALLNSENRAIVQTEAILQASPNSILWPTVGADVNVWWFTRGNPFGYLDLTPDKAGQTVTP